MERARALLPKISGTSARHLQMTRARNLRVDTRGLPEAMLLNAIQRLYRFCHRVSKCWMKTSDQGKSPSTRWSVSGQKACGAPGDLQYLSEHLSEKKDSSSNKRNSGNLNKNKKRKDFKKIVHSDAPNLEAPDPRWAGELSKLKDLLANQKTPA